MVLTEMKRRGKSVRGPYLAWLEFYKMVHEMGQDADQLVGKLFVKFRLFQNPCIEYLVLILILKNSV